MGGKQDRATRNSFKQFQDWNDGLTTLQPGEIRTLGEAIRHAKETGFPVPTDFLEGLVYGIDEPCAVCQGRGWYNISETSGNSTNIHTVTCSTCHGTGRLKTPGVV